MSERFATILKQDDGVEIVSAIAVMEGDKPEVSAAQKDKYRVIKAPAELKIGMVKGGPVDSVAGFGFPDGTPSARPATDDKVRADVSGKKG